MRSTAVILFVFYIFLLLALPAKVHPSLAQAAAPTVSLPVREGARGAEVKKIQARLRELGFYPAQPDGVFGPITASAVKRFQASRQLPTVGYVGPRTYQALFSAEPAREPTPQPTRPEVKPKQDATKAVPPSENSRTAPKRLPLPPPESEVLGGGGKRVALTFDDGPDPAVSPAILAHLDRYGASATFFVEGRKAATQADILLKMARAGHEVENHTFSHRPFPGRPFGEVQKEILDTAAIVRRVTGTTTRYLRPPGGALDDVAVAAARSTGHKVVLWTNVGASDEPFPGRERLTADLLVAAYDGAVIMLHGDRPETAAALPGILEAFTKKGYRLVRLDELMDGSRR